MLLEELEYLLGGSLHHVADNLHGTKNTLPDGWESYTMDDVSKHFGCEESATGSTNNHYDKSTRMKPARRSRPIPSLEYWLFLRKQYKELVDETAVFDNDPVPPTLGYSLRNHELAPFYAAESPSNTGSEISRSLYASRDIKKGEIVHNRALSESIFPDVITYRNYVLSLPRVMACDVIEGAAWTRPLKDGPDYISLDMNISSFIRSGGPVRANVMLSNSNSGAGGVLLATRDIKKDEEILTHFVRMGATRP
jgi:hypothetical protein